MPFYSPLRKLSYAQRSRTIKGLEALRRQQRSSLPTRTLKDTLLLATWNIRDFGNEDKRAKNGLNQPGPRLDESYYYIAEIISGFDIVAIQEINSLAALRRVMRILGPSWEYLTTDINPGKGGNEERMTFVYDKRKVRFTHMAGQIVTDERQQFVRTPYYASFQSGWFKFSLCTVHILYGDFKDTTKRIGEIDEIAGFLSKRAERTGENIILLGDFNILSRDDATFEPLNDHGWEVPLDFKTNVAKNKSYDQIAFKLKRGKLQRGPSEPNAGAFDFFKSVFLSKDAEKYYKIAKAAGRPMKSWDKSVHWKTKKPLTRAQYFRDWRTWQISDHMPLWLELKIDHTDAYLKEIAKKKVVIPNSVQMSLKAVLTVGWRDDVAAPNSALRLFEQASAAEKSPDAGLKETLERERPTEVQGLDRLFRLRVGGFRRLQLMTAALSDYADGAPSDVTCHIDAFAYAFLSAAKNLDLLLPEEKPSSPSAAGPFRRALPGWSEHIEGLREFEHVGAEIPAEHKQAYLALRRVVTRGSARDEQRALALLLVSGPSSIDDISKDLALSHNLGARVFGALHDAGILERDDDVSTIAERALPTVLFCLSTTMGLDYLKMLKMQGPSG